MDYFFKYGFIVMPAAHFAQDKNGLSYYEF